MTPIVTPKADRPGDSRAMSNRCWVRLPPLVLSKRGRFEALISMTADVAMAPGEAASGCGDKLVVAEAQSSAWPATAAPAATHSVAARPARANRAAGPSGLRIPLKTAVLMAHLQRCESQCKFATHGPLWDVADRYRRSSAAMQRA